MNPDYHQPLGDLVRATRQGDVLAYGRLVELTAPVVHATVRRAVHEPQAAEDVTQETYLRAYRAIGGLREPQTVVAWLQRIARSVSLNHLRAQRRSFVDHVDPATLPDPEPAVGEDQQDSLARAMVALSAADRRLCERYYYGGWTTQRLADALSLGQPAVRKRLQRIRDRLRREMTMSTTDLPDKIVEMLSAPDLTAFPENPVGALWDAFAAHFAGHEVLDLPERVDRAAVETVYLDQPERLERYAKALEAQDGLRPELTVSMLIAARGRRGPFRAITSGKVYRMGEAAGPLRLNAFHQAEALWVEEQLDEFAVMARTVRFLEELTGGARLRVTQVDYPMYCRRGWEVDVEFPEAGWASVCGLARYDDQIVRALGHDPARWAVGGAGIGLDRLACLRYGIDDIRKVAAVRV